MHAKGAGRALTEVSVVIPAYNEEARLGATLDRILHYARAQDLDCEILVVDDGSRDGTAALARDHAGHGVRLLENPGNRGKGYSVRHGMLEASRALVLFSDADLSTPIEELEALAAPVLAGAADAAIGSRAVVGSRVEVSQPLYRVAMGKIFNRFVRLIAVGGFADTQCGFKLFTRECARAVFARQRFEGFSFDVEVLYIARALGYRVVEVPVRWVNSAETKVSAIRDSSRMFCDLFKIRWNGIRGRYGADR